MCWIQQKKFKIISFLLICGTNPTRFLLIFTAVVGTSFSLLVEKGSDAENAPCYMAGELLQSIVCPMAYGLVKSVKGKMFLVKWRNIFIF